MNTDHKHYASVTVKAVDSSNPNGEFEAVISAATLDRDGEVIDAGAFEPLPMSIPVHVDHNASFDTLVGRAIPYYDGAVLKARGTFSSKPLAQAVRQDVIDGTLGTMSVGFMAPVRQTDKAGVVHIVRGELLEVSFVSIPSNRQAMVLSAKGYDKDKASLELAVRVLETDLDTL